MMMRIGSRTTTLLLLLFASSIDASDNKDGLCIAVGSFDSFPNELIHSVAEPCGSTILISSRKSPRDDDCKESSWCFAGDAIDVPLAPTASAVFALDSWDLATTSATEHVRMLRRWLSPGGSLVVVQSPDAKGILSKEQWAKMGFRSTHNSSEGRLVLVSSTTMSDPLQSRSLLPPQELCDLFENGCEETEGRLRRTPSLYQNNEVFAIRQGSWWLFNNDTMYEEVPKYYTTFSEHVAHLVPDSASRILDVGCGAGLLLRKLKDENEGLIVEGIEPNRVAAIAARSHSRLDAVYEGLAEDVAWQLPDAAYDAIIFSDVLEHAVHPDLMLRSLADKLKDGGRVCVSVPNVRFWTEFVRPLLDGSWDYAAHGVRDKTHLRWFTHDSFLAMASSAGFVPDGPAMRVHFGQEHKVPESIAVALVDVVGQDAAVRLLEESDVRQFLIPLKKKSSSG